MYLEKERGEAVQIDRYTEERRKKERRGETKNKAERSHDPPIAVQSGGTHSHNHIINLALGEARARLSGQDSRPRPVSTAGGGEKKKARQINVPLQEE